MVRGRGEGVLWVDDRRRVVGVHLWGDCGLHVRMGGVSGRRLVRGRMSIHDGHIGVDTDGCVDTDVGGGSDVGTGSGSRKGGESGREERWEEGWEEGRVSEFQTSLR